jgi:serine/threonine protein phosphatase PrpC
MPAVVVADGLGGHSRGEDASQLIVDVLGSVEPAATLAARPKARRKVCGVRITISYEQHCVARSRTQRQYGRRALHSASRVKVVGRDIGRTSARQRTHCAHARSCAGTGSGFRSDSTATEHGRITRAIGGTTRSSLIVQRRGAAGRSLSLCSDGLHGALEHEELRRTLPKFKSRARASSDCLGSRCSRSRDNVSAPLIVDILPEEPTDA